MVLQPWSRGRLNQRSGANFEAYFLFMGKREGLFVVANGLRAKRHADKVVAVRSNVDFSVLGQAADGEVAFIDTKSFAGKRFGRSMIDPRQLSLCSRYAANGFTAGFVVLLREIDHVGFYSAGLLLSGAARAGFGAADGVPLGSLRSFSLRKMWCPSPHDNTGGAPAQ